MCKGRLKVYVHLGPLVSAQGCVAIISLTWVTALTLFAAMVLPRGFYFNNDGLHACEPFYPRPSLRILASCLFYFPTTMVLMYCYGSAFHVNKLRLKRVVCAAIAIPEHFGGTAVEKVKSLYYLLSLYFFFLIQFS
jgi:hypothetical protein